MALTPWRSFSLDLNTRRWYRFATPQKGAPSVSENQQNQSQRDALVQIYFAEATGISSNDWCETLHEAQRLGLQEQASHFLGGLAASAVLVAKDTDGFDKEFTAILNMGAPKIWLEIMQVLAQDTSDNTRRLYFQIARLHQITVGVMMVNDRLYEAKRAEDQTEGTGLPARPQPSWWPKEAQYR
jgi:hypothetical protein